MRPSFILTTANTIITIVSVIWLFFQWKNLDGDKEKLEFLVMIGLLIGATSILLYMEEIHFDFNPLIGKTKINDNVVESINKKNRTETSRRISSLY